VEGGLYLLIVSLVAILPCRLALLATLHAGALVMLSLTDLGQNAGLGTAALETLQRAVQRLIFLDVNFRHLYFPPSAASGFIQDALRANNMALPVALYRFLLLLSRENFKNHPKIVKFSPAPPSFYR
jgi:hypothetical protein